MTPTSSRGADGAVQSFKSQFWRQVKGYGDKATAAEDAAAHQIIEKIQRDPLHSRSIDRVVHLLGAVTDPEIDGRIKKMAPKMISHFVPSQKAITGLAGRMRTLGKDLEKNFLMPGLHRPETRHFLEFAKECGAHADQLVTIRLSPFTKLFTYKAFWKRIPAVMLCKELDVPQFLSFRDIEKLVRCADRARGRKHPRSSRSIETQYKGFREKFMNLKSGQGLVAALALVEALLKITTPRN
jgi:hypothetical protein